MAGAADRRVPDPEELAEAIGDIRTHLQRIEDRLDQRYVPRELYDAKHTALRSEVAMEVAALKAQQDADRLAAERRSGEVRGVATTARIIAMWALGVVVTLSMSALVGFVATGGGT